MMDGARSLLVVGGPDTGKTLYGAQLLGRLNDGHGRLVMRGAAENISPLEEAHRRLAQGRTASHTSMHFYQELRLPVELPGSRRMDLIWPDYGGEQIEDMMQRRRISLAWRRRLGVCDGWLLFVRLDRARSYDDILSRPQGETMDGQRGESQAEAKWSEQAVLVELLQLLLFARGVGTVRPVERPLLTVLLSCWDELRDVDRQTLPPALLRERMPLFADFVSAVWRPDAAACFGLSSLGRTLRPDEADEDYVERGPVQFGYVVLPDGRREIDLTLPVSMLMERLS